ncbi:hypothetical protein KEM55_000561, partial [Ascosphaera atra]
QPEVKRRVDRMEATTGRTISLVYAFTFVSIPPFHEDKAKVEPSIDHPRHRSWTDKF